jgi:hypothetical protein
MMEAGFGDVTREEARSARLAKKEDAEAEREEAERRRRKGKI